MRENTCQIGNIREIYRFTLHMLTQRGKGRHYGYVIQIQGSF